MRLIIRRQRGGSIAEFAAALLLLIPLVVTLLFVTAEVVQGYMINTVLAQSAETAAREMALQYSNDATIASSKTLQDTLVYDRMKTPGIIVDSRQYDAADFSLDTDPKTVTVTVHYTGGQYGLSPFPWIDPLHLADNIQLQGKATYRIN